MKKGWILMLFALTGCATTAPMPSDELLADASFGPATVPVPAQSIFEPSPAMRDYLQGEFSKEAWEHGRYHGLLQALRHGQLRLEYDTEYTRTAAEAFEARSGNCLSLVILAAAFADEIGVPYTFQLVEDDRTWMRDGSLAFRSAHVNLSLGMRRPVGELRTVMTSRTIIDFMPPTHIKDHAVLSLSRERIVAMYHNNRAAELLASGDVDSAYWWVRKAIQVDPGFFGSWNTLGVVHERNGDSVRAERVFRLLLERDATNLAAIGNLARLLSREQRHAEAQVFHQRLRLLQPHPPYHFFERGMTALRQGNNAEALEWFRREADRIPYEDQVYFRMAQANLRLGNYAAAREALAKAEKYSDTRQGRQVYAAKLQRLRAAEGAL